MIYKKTGNYHIAHGLPNQDIVWQVENENIKAVIIADGVSTCKNSLIGAEAACKAIGKVLLDEADYIFSSGKEKTAELIVAYVYKKLLFEAKVRNETVESFSSTLSFACLNKLTRKVITFVLGDSLIYGVKKDSFQLVGSPVLLRKTVRLQQLHRVLKVALISTCFQVMIILALFCVLMGHGILFIKTEG